MIGTISRQPAYLCHSRQVISVPVSQSRVPIQTVPVYRAHSFVVTDGANLGDDIGPLDDLVFDDIFSLERGAEPLRLSVYIEDDAFRISQSSEVGRAGAELRLDCALHFMTPDGKTIDMLILIEPDHKGGQDRVYLLPLVPLRVQTPYTLVGGDTDSAKRRLAEVACVSFTRGTHITMSNGSQMPIEELKVGDRVLTRDGGVQAVRWIGQSTVRATGAFAPIVIRAGALNNENDLIVSPEHRLFVYQRSDEIGAGQSEVLVKARHLVNDDSVFVHEGGFVEYFQILFDRHHILYAEGIAAESMLIDMRTKHALPDTLRDEMAELPADQTDGQHGVDVEETLLERPDAVDLLRRASSK